MNICFILHLLATKYVDYHPLAILITRRVSHVAAHDLKNQARNLSVYDVVNAQLIARRLILAAIGFSQQRIDRIIEASCDLAASLRAFTDQLE
jgi:hypothetical protein